MAAPRRSPPLHSARLCQSSWSIFIRTTRCMTDALFSILVRSPILTAPEASFKHNLFFFFSGVPTSRANLFTYQTLLLLPSPPLSSMSPQCTQKKTRRNQNHALKMPLKKKPRNNASTVPWFWNCQGQPFPEPTIAIRLNWSLSYTSYLGHDHLPQTSSLDAKRPPHPFDAMQPPLNSTPRLYFRRNQKSSLPASQSS